MIRFRIYRLAGYVDGKPSWTQHRTTRLLNEDMAKWALEELRERFPKAKFKLRKIKK